MEKGVYVNIFNCKTWVYDFQITSFSQDNVYSNNSITYLLMWYFVNNTTEWQLFHSFLLDDFIKNTSVKKNFFFDNWLKSFLTNWGNNVSLLFFPELYSLLLSKNNFLELNRTDDYLVINELTSTESYIFIFNQILDFLFLFFSTILILVLYFSYYNHSTKENNLIDSNFLSSSILVESEKEIASLDDLILSSIILIYIFGWFFHIHVWNVLNSTPELLLLFYLLPFLAFLIFGVPSFLLIDFGIYCTMYIRGCGSYNSLIAELMYDYINVGSFYVRLCVQWVRLLLMYLTFIVMHDTIVFCNFENNLFIGTLDSIWEELSNIFVSCSFFSYLAFTQVLPVLIRLLFELAHTLFVFTAQFLAFFAIVFWFFSFLYTFFVYIKIENYFFHKRKQNLLK